MEIQPQSPQTQRKWGTYLGVLLVLMFGVFIGRYIVPASGQTLPINLSISADGQRQFLFPTFWEAWDALHKQYIGTLDDKNLLYGAVAGMVRAVGDPYTVFTDPEDSQQFRETLDGQFSGVGIEIGVRGGLVRVIAPVKGSPAEQAGVQAGDVVVGVDGETIKADSTIDDVVQAIRGPRGTQVTLSLARVVDGETQTLDVTITRDTITVESVSLEQLDGNIAHVSISSFNGDTTEQFAAIVSKLASNPPSGIVLDVRNNPGGFLQTAVDIAGNFLDSGTLVVTEKGDTESKHTTRGTPKLKGIPLVVLINKGSASASEILAGALADQLSVPTVGEQSFGKGSVQELVELKDGSSLRVTVAKWFTPSGRSIDDEGIEPTVEATDDEATDADEQLEAAMQALKGS